MGLNDAIEVNNPGLKFNFVSKIIWTGPTTYYLLLKVKKQEEEEMLLLTWYDHCKNGNVFV